MVSRWVSRILSGSLLKIVLVSANAREVAAEIANATETKIVDTGIIIIIITDLRKTTNQNTTENGHILVIGPPVIMMTARKEGIAKVGIAGGT